MLRELRIRNYAIIDDLTIDFRPGLNVITGETGAGKSVIIGALGLLCGARAGPELVRSGNEMATIEGLFDPPTADTSLEAFGLDGEDDLLIRRVVPQNGKGRVYVNGSPSTVAALAQLGAHLVHVYGQHEQALLLQPSSHLEFLDGFGGLVGGRAHMATVHAALTAARAHLLALHERRNSQHERRETLAFQVQELTEAGVEVDEEEALRREREVLRHAERLHAACEQAEDGLYSGDGAAVGVVARLLGPLRDLVRIDPSLAAPVDQIEAARVQLEDAARALGLYGERMRFDPERLQVIDERLALIGRLSRKYRVAPSELCATLKGLRTDLAAVETVTADCAVAQAHVDARAADALAVARELSAARIKVARRLEREMVGELRALGMSSAAMQVNWQPDAGSADVEAVNATGVDRLEFLLAANPGEAPRPLARVASGGELSRIMLALKALTATAVETPILIFDEVDAGVGGAVADAVARRLAALARTRQLLCITHLPQIAAYADHHFAVEKQQRNGRTIAQARILAPSERVAEISRMLGGAVAPAEAARYAEQLIHRARADAAR